MMKLTVLGLALEPPSESLLGSLSAVFDQFEGWDMFVCSPKGTSVEGAEMVRQPNRLPTKQYQRMAVLRNAVLKAWRSAVAEGDVVLWIDMDCAGFSKTDGLELLKSDESWDAVATFGLKEWDETNGSHPGPWMPCADGIKRCYFDIVAYESVNGTRHIWKNSTEDLWRSSGRIPSHCCVSKQALPVWGDDLGWDRVHSAFGPACFYRPSSISGLWYDEQTNQCEHQGFHQAMRESGRGNIFLAHDIVTHYDRLPKLEAVTT